MSGLEQWEFDREIKTLKRISHMREREVENHFNFHHLPSSYQDPLLLKKFLNSNRDTKTVQVKKLKTFGRRLANLKTAVDQHR